MATTSGKLVATLEEDELERLEELELDDEELLDTLELLELLDGFGLGVPQAATVSKTRAGTPQRMNGVEALIIIHITVSYFRIQLH